jgi:uncharacterized protein (DUF427 family)
MSLIRPKLETPAPGQESVWDYPCPPRVEPTSKRIEVVSAGELIVDTREAYRLLEMAHPPVYFVPPDAVRPGVLQLTFHEDYCSVMGLRRFFNVTVGGHVAPRAALSYTVTKPPYQAIQFYLAFYAGLMDECRVNGERVRPQDGGHYAGWITQDLTGPFKGGVGTLDW